MLHDLSTQLVDEVNTSFSQSTSKQFFSETKQNLQRKFLCRTEQCWFRSQSSQLNVFHLQNVYKIRMHFDYFCLFVLNCFAQFSCFELMIDSEIVHGVREPDGFTRQNLTCPEGNKILILSVRFGYRVRLEGGREGGVRFIIVCLVIRPRMR